MLLFLKVMMAEFIAEMGDKTQLMLIAMTSKFKLRDIIFGTAVAILVLNGIAVVAGGLVGSLVPMWLVKMIAAMAFLFFAFTALGGEEDGEEDSSAKGNFTFAPLTVFCTFFVAEMGDKTQLAAMTFGANEGLKSGVIVWLACSVGLFAADILGMLIGYLLKTKISEAWMNGLSFAIFAVFGILTMRQGMGMLFLGRTALVNVLTVVLAAAFALICVMRLRKPRSAAEA